MLLVCSLTKQMNPTAEDVEDIEVLGIVAEFMPNCNFSWRYVCTHRLERPSLKCCVLRAQQSPTLCTPPSTPFHLWIRP